MLKKQCKCLAELQADCEWVPAKERGWGGYKFLMISCVTQSHREPAAGPTDKSSCPNLPPAFCPSSGLFTHSEQRMLLPCAPSSPTPSHKQSSQKSIRDLAKILWAESSVGPPWRFIQISGCLKRAQHWLQSIVTRVTHLSDAGSCQPKTRGRRVAHLKIFATSLYLTF